MTRTQTPASAAVTARIIELRSTGLSWAQVGARVGMTRQAARLRAGAAAHRDTDVTALRAEVRMLRTRLARIQAILQEAQP